MAILVAERLTPGILEQALRPEQQRGHDDPAGPQPAPGSSRHLDFLCSSGGGRGRRGAPSPVPIGTRPCFRDLHHGNAPRHADRVGPLFPASPLADRAALDEPAHLGAGRWGFPVDTLYPLDAAVVVVEDSSGADRITWTHSTALPWQTLTALSFQTYALLGLFVLGLVSPRNGNVQA